MNDTPNSTSEKPKLVSISTRRKKNTALPWTATSEGKPPELQLVLMAYWEVDEDEVGGSSTGWGYNIGFYDNRDFWMTKDQQLTASPDRWLLVTDPKNE
jgi:hypothetical protein